MLMTCVVNGWPTEGYLDPTHPVQEAILATVADLAGEPIAHVAVDGCGAPIMAVSLTGLARAFARLGAGRARHARAPRRRRRCGPTPRWSAATGGTSPGSCGRSPT